MIWMGLVIALCILGAYILIKNIAQDCAFDFEEMAGRQHFKDCGVDMKAFIGMHRQEINHGEIIYVRKTTAYRGLIVFLSAYHLGVNFYRPFFNTLCRLGFIIAFQCTDSLYTSKNKENLEALLQAIQEDEVLSSYPRYYMGHRQGASTIALTDEEKKVLLCPLSSERDALRYFMERQGVNHHLENFVVKTLEKNNDVTLSETLTINEDDVLLADQSTYPFLKSDASARIDSLFDKLNRETSRFNYDHQIAHFPTEWLYELNEELIAMIDDYLK